MLFKHETRQVLSCFGYVLDRDCYLTYFDSENQYHIIRVTTIYDNFTRISVLTSHKCSKCVCVHEHTIFCYYRMQWIKENPDNTIRNVAHYHVTCCRLYPSSKHIEYNTLICHTQNSIWINYPVFVPFFLKKKEETFSNGNKHCRNTLLSYASIMAIYGIANPNKSQRVLRLINLCAKTLSDGLFIFRFK